MCKRRFLTLAPAEIKEFGKPSARQVIWDAQTLAKALDAVGFPAACSELGYTQSHQVFLDYGGYKQGRIVAQKLEKAHITVELELVFAK